MSSYSSRNQSSSYRGASYNDDTNKQSSYQDQHHHQQRHHQSSSSQYDPRRNDNRQSRRPDTYSSDNRRDDRYQDRRGGNASGEQSDRQDSYRPAQSRSYDTRSNDRYDPRNNARGGRGGFRADRGGRGGGRGGSNSGGGGFKRSNEDGGDYRHTKQQRTGNDYSQRSSYGNSSQQGYSNNGRQDSRTGGGSRKGDYSSYQTPSYGGSRYGQTSSNEVPAYVQALAPPSFEPESTMHKVMNSHIPKEKSLEAILQDIERVEKRLEEFVNVIPLEEVKVVDSKWNRVPEGLENLSAPRAKMSGLFPLPGKHRPVDLTKLEGEIRNKLNSDDSDLIDKSKIDAIDSKASKEIDHLKIVEFCNDYLKSADFKNGSDDNIIKKRKIDGANCLIIEFKNAECATILYSLNETELSCNSFQQSRGFDSKTAGLAEKFKLLITRPGEYVVQDTQIESDEVADIVPESPRKLAVQVNTNISANVILEIFEKKIGPVKGFQFLRQRGTKESLGLLFVEFKDTTPDIVHRLKKFEFVQNAFHACIIPNKTSIQKGQIDFNNLKKAVQNDGVTAHVPSRVIRLLNVVTEKELLDATNYMATKNDIYTEASKYGEVVNIRISRPSREKAPGFVQLNTTPGMGSVFIEYKDEKTALTAMMELAGKSYNDRTVLVSFFDYDDFVLNLF
ncbi:prp2 Splicing factor U2AF 59 kDa subunit [Candida maltosa Xu316]